MTTAISYKYNTDEKKISNKSEKKTIQQRKTSIYNARFKMNGILVLTLVILRYATCQKAIGDLDIIRPLPIGKPCCPSAGRVMTLDLNQGQVENGYILPGVKKEDIKIVRNPIYHGRRECTYMADLKVTFDRLSKCMSDWEQCTNRPTCGNRLLKIELDINTVHGGFMFNVGDSATNDGYGGDANTQRNDAEIMGLGQHTTVYYSDNCPGQNETFLNSLNTARKVMMWVGNEFTRIQTKDAAGSVHLDEQFCNKCLFALNMQPDQCPTCRNLDVYVALNNMIRGTHRRGFGVCKAKLSWECCQ